MKKFLSLIILQLLFLFNSACADDKAQDNFNLCLKKLGKYNEKEIKIIKDNIKSGNQSKIAPFVIKRIYEEQIYDLELSECKIIWKALLLTIKLDKDGFDLLEINCTWKDK